MVLTLLPCVWPVCENTDDKSISCSNTGPVSTWNTQRWTRKAAAVRRAGEPLWNRYNCSLNKTKSECPSAQRETRPWENPLVWPNVPTAAPHSTWCGLAKTNQMHRNRRVEVRWRLDAQTCRCKNPNDRNGLNWHLIICILFFLPEGFQLI